MKKLILLLIAIPGIMVAPAFADSTASSTTSESGLEAKTGIPYFDGNTEAVSVSRETACKTGLCPTPIATQPASLVDQKRAKELVDWIMNDGTGTPPKLTGSEATH